MVVPKAFTSWQARAFSTPPLQATTVSFRPSSPAHRGCVGSLVSTMGEAGEDLACGIVRFALVSPMAIVAVGSAHDGFGPRQARVRDTIGSSPPPPHPIRSEVHRCRVSGCPIASPRWSPSRGADRARPEKPTATPVDVVPARSRGAAPNEEPARSSVAPWAAKRYTFDQTSADTAAEGREPCSLQRTSIA